jgi:hypothetical protein
MSIVASSPPSYPHVTQIDADEEKKSALPGSGGTARRRGRLVFVDCQLGRNKGKMKGSNQIAKNG